MKCLLCEQQGHGWQKCPLFGSTEQYLAAMAPVPRSPEELESPAATSLAPTLFEQLYGQDENALAEMMDDERLGPNERILATELLIGAKDLKKLSKEEIAILDNMAYHLAASGTTKKAEVHQPQTKPKLDEDFDNQ
jgi:hypothetical protein